MIKKKRTNQSIMYLLIREFIDTEQLKHWKNSTGISLFSMPQLRLQVEACIIKTSHRSSFVVVPVPICRQISISIESLTLMH